MNPNIHRPHHLGFLIFAGPPNRYGEPTFQIWKRRQAMPKNVPKDMKRHILSPPPQGERSAE